MKTPSTPNRSAIPLSVSNPVPVPGSHTYRLKFFEEGDRPAKDIEFEAADAYQALVIARHEARRGVAELWRDGRRICTLCRLPGDCWEIGYDDAALPA